MYIIVVGMGNIGTPLIETATEGNNEVVVVERDEVKAEVAAVTFNCLVLNDGATVKRTFDEAGANRVNAIVTTIDKDATSIMVCLLAKGLDAPDIVLVVHDPGHMSLYYQIDADTTKDPQRLIAECLYCAVKRPPTINCVHIGEYAEVFEIRVDEDVPITGMTIQEAVQENLLDGDTPIVVTERGNDDDPVTPHGNTTIGAGNLLTVYSTKDATPEVTDVFGHYEDY